MQYFCILSSDHHRAHCRVETHFLTLLEIFKITPAKETWGSNCWFACSVRSLGQRQHVTFSFSQNTQQVFQGNKAPSGAWRYLTLPGIEGYRKLTPRLLQTFCGASRSRAALPFLWNDTQISLSKLCVIFYSKFRLEYLSLAACAFQHIKYIP